MNNLKTLQHDFLKSVYQQDEDSLLQHVAYGEAEAKERFAIYRNNVSINLTNALKLTFPVVCKLVDERFFHYAASEYIKVEQPSSGNLDEYGAGFADFLSGFPPVETLPYLPDVAQLEWLYEQSYRAADAMEGDLLHPSCRLLSSDYPVDQIWQMNQDDYQGNESLDISQGGVFLAIVRQPNHQVLIVPISEADFTFLQHLTAEENLEKAELLTKQFFHDFKLSVGVKLYIKYNIIIK